MRRLPVLELGGDPYARGVTHGKAMPAEIRINLETYMRRLAAGGLNRARVADQADAWVDFIAGDNPEYHEEMRGVADGAGLALREIAILNARYEITYGVFSQEAAGGADAPGEPDGCTSFGVLPEGTGSGHTLIGQNWDWLAGLRGRTLILRVHRADKPDFVGFTEAGIVGCKMGVNEAGIGLVVNGLVTRLDGRNGFRKPFHVRCREILDAWTFDKAILPIVQTNRVCSTNFLLGHADGEILDIEATPDAQAYLYPIDGLVTHSNHLLAERRVASEFERIAPHTLYRAHRLDRLLRRHLGAIDLSVVQAALGDHFGRPASICRHEDTSLPEAKRAISVTAIAIDLNERVLYATDGQICENPFQAFPLHPDAAPAA